MRTPWGWTTALALLCSTAFVAAAGQSRPAQRPAHHRTGVPTAVRSRAGLVMEPAAKALLQEVAAAYRRARALSGEIVVREKMGLQDQTVSGKFRALRPNYLYLEEGSPPMQILASDGKTLYTVAAGRYTKRAAPPDGRNLCPFPPLDAFFGPAGLTTLFGGPEAAGEVRLDPDVTVGGATYRVVHVKTTRPRTEELRFYIGPDRMVHRIRQQSTAGKDTMSVQIDMRGLQVDPPLHPQAFAYQPPAELKLYDASKSMEDNLVPVGSPSPEFSIRSPAGGAVSLAGARRGRKAVLVNFWFYG